VKGKNKTSRKSITTWKEFKKQKQKLGKLFTLWGGHYLKL
jgi:hypothetical protein